MKQIQSWILLTSVLICVPSINAAGLSDRFRFSPGEDNYGVQEWRFDVFGTWGSLDRDDFSDDSMGFGLGANYFFNRYLGLAVDTYIEEVEAPNHLDFSFVGRYPVSGTALAPYAFAGVGRQFHDVSQWSGHLGGGAEYRFNPSMGVFTDVRGVFLDKTEDIALIRFGFRVGF
jgi:hypothetical protein